MRIEVVGGRRSEVRDSDGIGITMKLGRRLIVARELTRVGRAESVLTYGPDCPRLCLQQARVVTHHEVTIDLLDQIERNAHRDEQTCPAVEARDRRIDT
jgi:hypothetical protein